MAHCVTARNSLSRLWIALIAFAFLDLGSGCQKPEAWRKEDIDRQACLGSRLAPIDALASCSRFIVSVGDHELKRADAYYNRGIAFAELGEFRHAQLDLEKALELDPRNLWARHGLDDVKQSLSKSAN
jgi:tetratricopeptide (TPR) repeat protein